MAAVGWSRQCRGCNFLSRAMMVAEGSNGYRTWGAGSYGVRFTNFLTTVASEPKVQWCVRMNRVL